MTAMTTQPTADTTIFSEFDAKYCYVATVQTPEFVAGAAVSYVGHTYNPVTRGGYTADLLGVGATPRVSIASATSPGSSFVVLVVFYNEAATTEGMIVAAKTNWNNTNGFYVANKTNVNTLEINGGGSGYPTIAATGVGASGTLHTLAIEFSGTSANLSMDGNTLGTVTGLTAAGTWPSGIAFGNYSGTADGVTTSRSIIMGVVLGTKGSKTLNELTANPWLIFDAGGSEHSATGALSSASATLSGSASRTAATVSHSASGSLTSSAAIIVGAASRSTATVTHSSTGALTAQAATLAGTSARSTAGVGAFSTPPIKNNTGTLIASVSGWTVNVYNASTGALVVQKTGLSTDSSGVLTVSDALLSPGTTYAYEPSHATYGRRLPTGSAA